MKMPLIHRNNRNRDKADDDCAVDRSSGTEEGTTMAGRASSKNPRTSTAQLVTLSTILLLLGLIIAASYPWSTVTTGNSKKVARGKTRGLVFHQDISTDASLTLQFAPAATATKTNGDNSSLPEVSPIGPHSATLFIKDPKTCTFPRFWMRLTGTALVHVALAENEKRTAWTGSFSLPKAGAYSVETRWYGCKKQSKNDVEDSTTWTSPREKVTFTAVGDPPPPPQAHHDGNNGSSSLFPPSSLWFSTKSVNVEQQKLPSYIWSTPEMSFKPTSFVKASNSVVVKEGTVQQPKGFYDFGGLGNYELLCFMGSETMSEIHGQFMSMRAQLFPYQRPFKFHMYSIRSFVKPDRDWELETKKRVRKCKHILVSVDEFREEDAPLTRDKYKSQITTFIGHLLKLMNDDTFPIWIFTVNEPPMKASNCLVGPDNTISGVPRTTDHPCNDVLKDLFRQKTFPSRVHLLDNTDVSLPRFDDDENRKNDVLAVIALRIYVFVGKGVADWRAAGQHGKIDGLHRNGKVEPNFELVPYEGWR